MAQDLKNIRHTNEHSIDLPLLVWLLQDGYKSGADVAPEGELISATTLLKSTRSLILQNKVDPSDLKVDVSSYISSRMGHAIHDSIEEAWKNGQFKKALRILKYPKKIIDNIVVNPKPEELEKNHIPVYMEQRAFKQFDGVVITGQLDFAINGALRDFKSTSVFSNKSVNTSSPGIFCSSSTCSMILS